MPATDEKGRLKTGSEEFLNQRRSQAWIALYRDILNRERLWIYRAKFDVARAERCRERRRATGRMNNGGLKQPLVSARRSGGESVMQERHVDSSSLPETAEDIALVGLQAQQLSARCNYCSATFNCLICSVMLQCVEAIGYKTACKHALLSDAEMQATPASLCDLLACL